LKTIYNTTRVSLFVESCNAEPGLREIAGSRQARPSTTPSSRGKSKTSFKFDVIWDQGSVYFASPVSDAVGGCLLIAMSYSGTSKNIGVAKKQGDSFNMTSKTVCDFVMVHSSHSCSCNMNSCPHYVGLQHVLGSQLRELEPFNGCEVIKHLPTNFAGVRVHNPAQFTGGGAGQKKLTVLCRRVQDHSKDNFRNNYLIFKLNYFISFLMTSSSSY